MSRIREMYAHAIPRVIHLDAVGTAALARELESIQRDVTMTVYPDLLARTYVPQLPDVQRGAEHHTWRRMDLKGMAKLVGNDTTDLPDVDVDVKESFTPLRSYGNKYGYTVEELDAFELARSRGSNIQLDTARADAAHMLIDRKLDQVIAIGDPLVGGDYPIVGMCNHPDVTIFTPITGNWLTATAPQILADVNKLVMAVINQSFSVTPPDTILMPIDRHALLSTMPLGANNDKTVMDFILKNNPWIKAIEPWWYLSTAGASGGPRVVAYKRSVEVVGHATPILFEALPPQPKNLKFDVPCRGKTGGSIVRFPLGMAYMDGI
jgi:hypothetical protein